jgi:hypothetical protein
MRNHRRRYPCLVAAALAVVFLWSGVGSGQQSATVSPPGPRLNKVIDLLEKGKPAFGIFNGNFGVRTAMSLSRSDLDYVLIDMEHRPLNVEQLQIFLMAMTDKQAIVRKGSLQPNVVPLVRIPQYGRENLMFIVKQVLDVGVFGIMFPHIDTADQARKAVQASRYPTTSPGRSVGIRTCSTYARKLGLSIGPSKTAGALIPSNRSAAMTVCVCQWLHGV